MQGQAKSEVGSGPVCGPGTSQKCAHALLGQR